MNLLKACITGSLFLLITAVLSAETYRIETLGLNEISDVTYSLASTINNKSEVSGVFSRTNTGLSDSIFIWNKDEGLMEIASTHGAAPKDSNDQGVLVWLDVVQHGFQSVIEGFLWHPNNTILKLANIHPHAVNNEGIIACSLGNSKKFLTFNLKENKQYSNDIEKLDLFKKYKLRSLYVFPHGINSKGEVVGQVTFSGDPLKKAYNLPSGHLTNGFLCNIYTNDIIDFGIRTTAVDINDYSQVLLVSDYSEKGTSWMWENGAKHELWKDGLAKAINNYGVVVGKKSNNAVIWENGRLQNLFELVENPEGWESLTVGWDINDYGEIVGEGIWKGKHMAFILVP